MNDMQRANETATELLQLLANRVEQQQSSPQTDQERLQTLLAPVVIMLANLFQEPVQNAQNPRKMAETLMDFSGRWVFSLLGLADENQ